MQPLLSSKEQQLLGQLCDGEKKLQGKTFYLDNVKKRSTTLLLEAISLLGGKIESFLHKDVDFVVTGSQEVLKEEKCVATKGGGKGTSEGAQGSLGKQETRRPGTPRPMACGSRGKALLEKAICNNEHLQRSSVLSNARSWGVKILYVDDVLFYLKQLSRDSFSAKHKRKEKTSSRQSIPVIRAASLRSPYLKIEDISRKYKPLHMQSITFPALCYSGRFSPFESPPPPRFEKQTGLKDSKKREMKIENSFQGKSQSRLGCNPSPWRPRKKDSSYCECCQQIFTNLEEHLQSDQHRSFALDPSNYRAVDQLVAEMLPGFDPDPSQQSEERPPTPLPVYDELEPLTDLEMESAVQVPLKEDSPFRDHTSDPIRSRLSSSPARQTQEVPFTDPDPAIPTADPQSFNPETNHQSPSIQPRALSPAMPVLTIETLEPETIAPCSDSPCLLSDPYSLPPVLSPQVSYALGIMDPLSPYSEPPILSPQKRTTEETSEGHSSEMNPAESGSKVAVFTLLQVSGTTAEEERGSHSETLVGHRGVLCSRRDPQSPCRSYSLPRPLAAASNPRKRCRSASPEHRNSKKRRMAALVESGSLDSAKPPVENMSDIEDDSLCDNVSCPDLISSSASCSVDLPDLKPSCSTFSFPPGQNIPSTLNQANSISPVKGDKPQNTISSQDSLCSNSLSASVCIEPALIPDLATLSSASSDSDWDCDLLSRLGPTSAVPPTSTKQNRELDKELLRRSCPWMHDTSYESRLHNVLQPSAPASSLCGEDADPLSFSRTVVQIVEVQH